MKIFKVILKTITSIVVLIVVGVGIVICLKVMPREDSIFVKDAEFDSSNFEDVADERFEFVEGNTKPTHQVQLHRLKQGKGVILAIRKFKGQLGCLGDCDGYEKLTISLPDLREGKFTAGGPDDRAYYSGGNSAFPNFNCGGVPKGSVEVINISRRVVTVSIDVQGNCVRGGSAFKFSGVYKLSRMSFDALTPWIGKRSDHIYQETFRPIFEFH